MSATAPPMTPGPPGDPPWTPTPVYPLSLAQYERMVDEGIIGEHDRVHLINGVLVARMTQDDPHCTADDLCAIALRQLLPPGWYVRGAKPIRIPGGPGRRDSKPEPDRCVVRGTVRDYEERTPGPADVALIAEIADSSLSQDRKLVAEVYGPSGVPVCWIVDVNGRRIEVHTAPGPRGYATTETFVEGQSVPVVIDGREVGRIAVADLLPRARPAAGPVGRPDTA